eukprot:1158532-Pelagomonas_calceolata.AAC.21
METACSAAAEQHKPWKQENSTSFAHHIDRNMLNCHPEELKPTTKKNANGSPWRAACSAATH